MIFVPLCQALRMVTMTHLNPRYSATDPDDLSQWKGADNTHAEVDYGAEEWASTSTDLKEIPTPMFSLVARVSVFEVLVCEVVSRVETSHAYYWMRDVWHSVAYLSENHD